MENNFLGREDAPISSEVWKVLDSTMAETAKSVLTGRRLLHLEGPYGLGLKAVPLPDSRADSGIITSGFVPVSLIDRTFRLSKRDLAFAEKSGMPINASAVASAAIEAAMQEDSLVFHGTRGLPGLLSSKGVSELKLSSWDAMGKAVEDIISAVTLLDKQGFHGPYSLALAPSRYNLLFRRYPQGGTELEYVQALITDGVFKAPIMESGGVLIASGRQYAAIVLGQDMSLGFIGPAGSDSLEFSLSESIALLVREPKAVCVLK
jgi:uncharacterized linocin/CFP29 family protein